MTLVLPVARQRTGDFRSVAGVLTASNGFGGQRAVIVDAPLTGVLAAGTGAASSAAVPASSTTASSALNPGVNRSGAQPGAPAQEGSALSLSIALVFALIGGVLLNLMPCVFPVLSLKVLGFATHRESRASMRLHGLAFAAGVIVSFWMLAAALVALRAAGRSSVGASSCNRRSSSRRWRSCSSSWRSIFPACSRYASSFPRRWRDGTLATRTSTMRCRECSRW